MQGSKFFPLIAMAGQQYGVDPAVLAATIRKESGFDVNAHNAGSGAHGLGQFIPGTAQQYGVNVHDPKSSIFGMAHFLGDLKRQFHGNMNLALAGYNAGPGAVQKYGGIPPYKETQNYVNTINKWRQGYQGAFGQPQQAQAPVAKPAVWQQTPQAQMQVTGRLAPPDDQMSYAPPPPAAMQPQQSGFMPRVAQAPQPTMQQPPQPAPPAQPPNQPGPQATQSMIDGSWNTPAQTQMWNQMYQNYLANQGNV